MEPSQEVFIELEPGKTMVLRLLGLGETDEEGMRKVFFELNGQPRTIRIENRAVAASANRHPKAEEGNPNHVAAPMPGMVASVAVEAGRAVAKGDLLLTIEAMKMETALHAERDGTVARVVVKPGDQIDAKDLLVELEASG